MRKLLLIIFLLLICPSLVIAEDFYVGSGQTYPDATCSEANPGDFTSCEAKLDSTDDRLILKCDSGTECTFHCADHDNGGCNSGGDILTIATQSGTANNPIEIMAYPGHTVTFTAADELAGADFSDLGSNVWESPAPAHTPNSSANVKIKDSSTFTHRVTCPPTATTSAEYCITGGKLRVYSVGQPTGTYIVPYNADRMFNVQSDYIKFVDVNISGSNYRGLECGKTSGSGDTLGCEFTGTDPVNRVSIKYCDDGCLFGNSVDDGGSNVWTYSMSATNAELAYNTNANGHCYKCGSFDAGSLNQCEAHNIYVHHCADHGMWASAGTATVIVDGLRGHSMNWGGASGRYVLGVNSNDVTSVSIKNVYCTRGDTNQTGCLLLQGNALGYPSNVVVDGLIAIDTNYDGIAINDSPDASSPNWPTGYQLQNIITYNNDRSGIRVEDSISIAIRNWSSYNDGNSSGEGALMLDNANADGVSMANSAFHSTAGAYNVYISGSPTLGSYTNNRYYENSALTGVINNNGSAQTLSAWKTATSTDTNSTEGDPEFTDPSNGFFKPLPGSPLINTGVSIKSQFTGDVYGNPRGTLWNIGAIDESGRQVM